MGIDIVCGNKEFSCSYSHWNALREDAIMTSLLYINDETKIVITDVNSVASITMDQINILRNLGLNGLHVLCMQFDCEGYYTPGNSMDICILFDIIYPEESRSKHLQTLYELFDFSWKMKTLVIIM